MSNPRDGFGKYVELEGEQAATHMQNADPDSHKRPGGLFDPSKPRRIRTTIIDNDEDPAEVLGDRVSQRKIRRHAELGKMVEDALVNRVQPPTGNMTMKIGFEEFVQILQDPEFEPFSKYGQALLFYSNGKPREHPIRPLIANEVGMYRGKFVVLDRMPDESKRGDIPYVQVKEKLEHPALLVEKDPFPSSKREEEPKPPTFAVERGGDK